jgi:lipid II:glycine glycyltransferase (peptidoglycan interpeptide bridge formation enzyme)
MNKLSFTILNAEWHDKYSNFVKAHKGSMIYHGIAYKNLLNDLLQVEDKYLIAIDQDENIQAVLPLMYKKGQLGYVINSLPFYGSNGAIISNSKDAFDFLIESYNQLLLDKEIAASTIVSNPLLIDDNYDGITFNVKDHRIGQFTEIAFQSDHENKLMESFHYKTRNMIRKSQKQDIEVVVDNSQVEFIRQTHIQNLKAIGGRAKNNEFFRLFPIHFKEGTDYKIYIAKENGIPIAGLLLFYYKNTVEYYSPVIVEEHRERQPLSLLIFQAMKDASENGFELWNWGGTWASQDGVYRFKKRWGTKDINYYYYTQINNEQIYSSTKDLLLSEYADVFVLPFQNLLNQNE